MKDHTTFFRLFAILASFLSGSLFCLAQDEYPADFDADQLYFRKITSTDDLSPDALYIIVTEDGQKGLYAFSKDKMTGVNILTPNGIYQGEVSNTGKPYEMVISRSEGKYILQLVVKDGSLRYLDASLGLNPSLTYWTISFDENGNALIESTPGKSIYFVDEEKFKCTDPSSANYGTYQKIYLYRKESLIQISDKTDGFATFYNKDFIYSMPEGLEGFAVEDTNEENTTVTTALAYSASYVVPKNMALLIHGAAGAHRAPVMYNNLTAYTATNYLEGTRDANDFTLTARSGSVEYFKLGLGASQDQVGFYWGAENGGQFKMSKTHTAYLALPTTNGTSYANGLSLHYNETTGLQILPKITPPKSATGLFDLSGRKLRHTPMSGVYIQDGKKIILK